MKKILLLLSVFMAASCSKKEETKENPELPYSMQEFTEEENVGIIAEKLESLYVILDF